MRSTRSLLIVYFLTLLAIGLGLVTFLADRVVVHALSEREKSSFEAADLRTEERIKGERDKFEQELLTHARMIGRIARTEYLPQSDVDTRKFNNVILHTYMAGFGPTHGLWAATWHSGIAPQPRRSSGPNQPSLFWSLLRSYLSNLRLDELFLKPLDSDERMTDYVQISGPFSSTRRSENLMAAGYTLPFHRRGFDKVLEDWQFDDVTLPRGQHGRRVVFKTPIPVLAFGRFGPPPPRDRAGPPPPPPSPDLQLVYVHVARPTTEFEQKVATFRAEADRDKQTVRENIRRTISWIRFITGVTVIGTFLACLVGSSWLIRRGLTPLNRLSDAVSMVSERDFHLAVNREELSTELQPIHERITETLEQLKAAFEREKQAVADISHELRTPVASLLATLDVALRKPRTADQYLQTLKDCRGITKQLGQLVEKVMTLAYLDAGQTKMSAVPADVTGIAESCAAVIRPLAEAHGLKFVLHADGPIEVTTDPDKLREVLTNLLHNAVEYNRAGGRVELDVTADPDGVQFLVKDTGIGMTADVREKIFERFYRADPSRTATGVHAGLGLAIVKEYVERLGGSIDVASEPDVGSTFRVLLPAA
jgi:signal transduction histidine kinase